MAEPELSLFEQLGGEPVLRRIMTRFVARIVDDVMIGFFFRDVDHERLIQREVEFAARHLGADIAYTGRALTEAHAPHRIMGGQFMRRLQILKETLAEFQVADPIREHFVEHTLKLMPQITGNLASECISPSESLKLRRKQT